MKLKKKKKNCGTRIHGTRVPFKDTTKNWAYSGIFCSAVCQKRHYRYPIVAFSVNADIGIPIATFKKSYSGVLNKT